MWREVMTAAIVAATRLAVRFGQLADGLVALREFLKAVEFRKTE